MLPFYGVFDNLAYKVDPMNRNSDRTGVAPTLKSDAAAASRELKASQMWSTTSSPARLNHR